jgi:hypothetical protein
MKLLIHMQQNVKNLKSWRFNNSKLLLWKVAISTWCPASGAGRGRLADGSLQHKGFHHLKYGKEDQERCQMKFSLWLMEMQMNKCSLGVLAFGILIVSGIDHAKGMGEIDSLELVTQPCFLHPNLAVIAQLSLVLCQAMCQQRSCSVRQSHLLPGKAY